MNAIVDPLTPEQKAVVDYLQSLEKTRETAWLLMIVTPTEDGAKINAKELGKLFDTLGYDGSKEAAAISYDFADVLAGLYKDVDCSTN